MILPHPDHLVRVASPAEDAGPAPVRRQPIPDCEPSTGRGYERQRVGRFHSSSSTPEPSSAELTALVVRAQAGDLAAQSELVLRYQRRLAGQIRLIVRDPAAVEDVVQTVLVKMLRRLGRLREPAAFECWLFRLSRNTSLDYIRRQRRRPLTVAADEELHQIPDTSSPSATGEILEALDRALAHLSPKDRSLVTLFIQGHSYRVIADREGLTSEAVKARLHRARPILRATVGAATATRQPGAKGWRVPAAALAA